MVSPPPLRIGTKISSATGVAQGRIGGFATNADGRLFALIARHVALAEPSGIIFHSDEKLGPVRDLPILDSVWEDNAPNMAAAIAAVDITDAHRPIVIEEAGLSVSSHFEDPEKALDVQVRTLSDSDTHLTGYISWVGSRVNVRFGGTLPPIRYTGAVEVSVNSDSERRLSRGDAGMPVVDHRGRLVGLAISGSAERCFVAPIAFFLKRHGLTLYQHKLAAHPAETEKPLVSVTAVLRDASLNLSDWMSESRPRSTLFKKSTDGTASLILEPSE